MGGKRIAASTGAGPAKKPKADPVTTKCDEVVAALKGLPSMPAGVREMVAAALPQAMVPEAERHALQERMITVVAEQMAKVEAGLQAAVEQAGTQAANVAKEKEECASTAAKTSTTLSEKKAISQDKKVALARDAGDVRAAKGTLAEAERKLQAAAEELAATEKDHAELLSASEVLKPLLDGAVEQDAASQAAALVSKLQRIVRMEDSLLAVAPTALSKVPSARGPFELMVVNELTEQCSKRIAALAAQVEAAAPAKTANIEAVSAAQSGLAEARARQRASAEAFTAARCDQEQSEAAHAASTKALKAAGPRVRSADKALQDAAGRLEGFRAGPAVSFAELRTRAVPAEAPAVGAAAPGPSSCAAEVASATPVAQATAVAAAA